MIFDAQTAKRLQVLVHPDIEQAILLLLDTILVQEEDIYSNPLATDAQLRMLQGKKMLIKDLKEYKKRLNDAVIRGNNGAE